MKFFIRILLIMTLFASVRADDNLRGTDETPNQDIRSLTVSDYLIVAKEHHSP